MYILSPTPPFPAIKQTINWLAWMICKQPIVRSFMFFSHLTSVSYITAIRIWHCLQVSMFTVCLSLDSELNCPCCNTLTLTHTPTHTPTHIHRRSRSPRGQRHSPPREDRERRRGRSRSRSHSPRRHHSPSKDSRFVL